MGSRQESESTSDGAVPRASDGMVAGPQTAFDHAGPSGAAHNQQALSTVSPGKTQVLDLVRAEGEGDNVWKFPSTPVLASEVDSLGQTAAQFSEFDGTRGTSIWNMRGWSTESTFFGEIWTMPISELKEHVKFPDDAEKISPDQQLWTISSKPIFFPNPDMDYARVEMGDDITLSHALTRSADGSATGTWVNVTRRGRVDELDNTSILYFP